MRKGVLGRMTGLLALVAMVAIGALLLSPSIDIGSDSNGGLVADLSGIADVDVGVQTAKADSPASHIQCFAAKLLKVITYPFFQSYWSYIISRVCSVMDIGATADGPAEVARSGTYAYEAIRI